MTPIPREFFARSAAEVAPELLGAVIEHRTPAGLVAVRLTEVEAYAGEADPASHAYRGRTRRTAVMFGPPGHAYVYFTYGMHFCMNLVCLGDGTAAAVLLRAGEVIEGEGLARARRATSRRTADLARGPARLCRALGIDSSLNGADVCTADSPLRVRCRAEGTWPGTTDRSAGKTKITTGPRVGVTGAAEVPWRFWIEGAPSVSAYRPHAPRRRGVPGGSSPRGQHRANWLPPSRPMVAPCRAWTTSSTNCPGGASSLTRPISASCARR